MPTIQTSTPPSSANVVKLSERDLLDYRAVQRTFDGAYARTALGQLCYATVILRLFQPKFFYIGLVYAILGMLFIPVAIFRYRMAVNNAHRLLAMQEVQPEEASNSIPEPSPSNAEAASGAQRSSQRRNTASSASPEPAQPVRTVLRESFVTAGSVVAAATALVGLAEIALLVLILRV